MFPAHCENISFRLQALSLATVSMRDAVLEFKRKPNVDQHFDGRSPEVRLVYDAVVAAARNFGPVEEDPKKTSIHLNRKSAFAGIQTRREFLIFTVKSPVKVASDRITKQEQVSANRWHVEIKLHHAADVDAEITDWLRNGYEISG